MLLTESFVCIFAGNTSVQLAAREGHPKVLERLIEVKKLYVQILNFSTVQLHYNTPHYNAVFNITRPCHGSQNDYFAICLL